MEKVLNHEIDVKYDLLKDEVDDTDDNEVTYDLLYYYINHIITRLKEVINLLVQDKRLPVKYREHYLTGNYKGFKECHIGPDWLLIYKTENELLTLTVLRTGSHSDLF